MCQCNICWLDACIVLFCFVLLRWLSLSPARYGSSHFLFILSCFVASTV
uniref:Predicted protein n=1 Tax=Hordeum vulgare subsp. vulgare TaxID=112509 RepID=F2D5R1_HORVV|nr:predicted protein [Hordeum vulgare subsp. vulgare]